MLFNSKSPVVNNSNATIGGNSYFASLSDVSQWFFKDEPISFSSVLFEFFVNPQAISYTFSNKFSESDIYKKSSYREYVSSGVRDTLTLTGMIVNTSYAKISLEEIIKQLQNLVTPLEEYNHPPVVALIFGESNYHPYAVLEINIEETGWISGKPSHISCDMTLVKLTKPIKVAIKTVSPPVQTSQLTGIASKVANTFETLRLSANGAPLLPLSTKLPPFTPREATEAFETVPESDLTAATLNGESIKTLSRNNKINIDLSTGELFKA